MKTRKLGRLSYAHVLRARDGIERALKDQGIGAFGGIDGEAKRRYSLFRRACSALDVEAKAYVVNDTPEAKIGKLGARVGRLWSVLRRMLQELARLADVLPAGEEAEQAHRKFFPDGLLFVNQGAQVEIHHGKALLAEIEAHAFSPYLSTMLAPILVHLREEQLVYEVALGEKLVTVKRTPELRRLRTVAIAALVAFVDYVEVTVTDDASRARADAILAPVDLLRAMARPSRGERVGKGSRVVVPSAAPTEGQIEGPSGVPSRLDSASAVAHERQVVGSHLEVIPDDVRPARDLYAE